MIDWIVEFSVKQRLLVVVATLILAAFGLWAALRLPIDAFPDVTNVQVQIIGNASRMSPPEVEKLVTFPIEVEMGGLPRVNDIRSVSKTGFSLVTVVFEDGVDDYFARQLVFERLQGAKDKLPVGVEVSLGPMTTGLGEIFQYTLQDKTGKFSLIDLRTIQDYTVRPILRTVPGVTEVESFGGLVKQYQVIVNPDRLTSYNLTLHDVFDAVSKNNANAAGSYIEHKSEQWVVRGLGLAKNADDIGNIVVTVNHGTPVYVRNVAEVRIGSELRQGAVTMNGNGEVVSGVVLMLKGASGREVVDAVKAKLPEIQKALPPGVELVPFYDRTELVKKCIGTVTHALRDGAVFVLLVLVLLLGNFRSAIIVSLVLPLSALAAFIMMRWVGLSANLMSLGGLAIGIGMMVDGAVVMVENIFRHLTEHQTPDHGGHPTDKIRVVLNAAREVNRPIVFGIAIIIVVFLPLFTLQGLEGKMFSPLAFTISFALLGSLVLSLTLVPTLCTWFLPQREAKREPRLLHLLKRAYLPLVTWSVRHPKTVVGGAIVLLLGSFAFAPFIGTEFLPTLDEGSVLIQTFRDPSVSLTQSLELQTQAEKLIKRFPEVVNVVSKTGRAELASDPQGVDGTDMIVMLKPREQWTTAHTKEELVEKMRESLGQLPATAINVTQPIQDRVDELISGVKASIAIKIFGDDIDVLKREADHVANVLGKVAGATDINVERVSGLSYLQIRIDRNRIARYGINVADINDLIDTAIGGKEASRLFEGQKSFGILVRFPESQREDIERIKRLLVETPDGARLPLGQLASVSLQEGPAQISREAAQRRIVIECNATGRDIGGFVKEARQKIDAAVKLPPGYFITWGGQFENQQRAMRRFMLVIPLTVGIIFFLLFSSFNSLKQALLIITNIPFALMGGILALVIGHFNMSVSASVGFIALFGVAVLNGVVMVSYFNELRGRGQLIEHAVVQGAALRLRPVLITALVAALGLVPMLFATGPGSEIQKPLAAVVIGGLISSTLLTLIVLPVLYRWFEREPTEAAPVEP
ncbi:MAG TPA: efflux RND transporter permease subunit [Verrucomicrobiae bacterium]|nr:efflux RND transporter permease subunit [Verrucomicrobiae bacterium]